MVPGGEPPQGAARPARPTPARLTPPAQPAPAAAQPELAAQTELTAQPELAAQPEVAALPGPGLVNVANALTVLRLVLVPVFADKALTGAALVTLSALGELAWWVTAVILAREIAVTLLRFWVIRHGVIAASRGGKLKTLLQVVAIALYVLPGPPAALRAAVMAAAVAVTVVTGIDYGVRAMRLHRRQPHAGAGAEP